MAKLIKLRTKPQKHLLKKSLAMVITNRVLTVKTLANAKEQLLQLNVDIARAKRVVLDFHLGIKNLAQRSIERGIVRSRTQLITEIFMLAAQFHQNLKEEAKVIEGIARKIAANITNSPVLHSVKPMDKETEDALQTTFALSIITQEDQMPTITPHVQRIKDILGTSIEIRAYAKLAQSQVVVTMLDNTMRLDLMHADLESTLKSASSHILG